MAIDYKPEQNDYTNLTPFKTWLVNQINTWGINNFPFLESDFDKLTNYGMMMKLMKAMNDVIGNQNLVESDMSNLFNAFTELQNYINNYFDNLDIQEEINNKLDEMAESGELTNLIKDYVDPIYQSYEERINNNINTQNGIINTQSNQINTLNSRVDSITSLAEGSTTGDAELTDIRTMFTGETVINAGTAVRSESSIINNIAVTNKDVIFTSKTLTASDFESGQISSSGVNTTFPSRFRTKNYIAVKKGSIIYTDGAVQFNICVFTGTSSSTLVNYRGFSSNYYVIPSDCYIRFSINDGSSSEEFSDERVNNALSHMTLYLLTDTKINQINNDIDDVYNNISNIRNHVFQRHRMTYEQFEQGQISSSGINTTLPSRFRTIGYIKVLKGSSISTDGNVQFNICCFSGKNSSYLIDYRTYGTGKFIVNQDCYIRFSINDGSSSEEFSSQRVNNALSHMTFNLYYQIENDNKSIELTSPFVPYNFNETIVPWSTSNKLSTLYSLWDSLVSSYPNYVSKSVLGTTTDDLEIRKYVINSNSEKISLQQIDKQKLIILYVGAMHGNEETIALDDYMMFKDLLDNFDTNEALKNLFDNITFEVIPTINPYGYEHNTRNNANNVNINRNFNANWQYSTQSGNESGSAPESEVETQILTNYVRNNTDKLFLIINRHSTASLTSGGVIGYFASAFKSDQNIGYATIRTLNSQIRSNYNWLGNHYTKTQNCYTVKKIGEYHGTFDEWYATEMNIHGFLIELATTSGDSYTGSRDDMRKIAISSVVSLLQNIMIKNKYILEDDTINIQN